MEYCPGKAGAIYLDGRPVAFVCYADFDQIPEHQAKFIRDNRIKTVLKYVYNSGTDYTGVGVPVIPFGYVAPGMFSMCPYGEFVPFAGRKYNLMARMRTHLEAGTHYIKCSTTDEFTALFNSTILDVKRMEEIGRAGYDFYLAHLSPQKWGNTFWPG